MRETPISSAGQGATPQDVFHRLTSGLPAGLYSARPTADNRKDTENDGIKYLGGLDYEE